MSAKDTVGKTIGVALALCIVCSVLVSTAAVMLKPAQQANQREDMQRNILAAAGMYEKGVPVAEQFANITPKVVDLGTGRFTEEVSPESYDQLAAAKDPSRSQDLSGDDDTAGIGRREEYGLVYVVGDPQNPDRVIVPIRGAGLWGQMYGFLALEDDINTIAGIGFYDHKETPGLGGEVDNPNWKAQWSGKAAYGEQGEVAIEVIKGTAGPSEEDPYRVDGLSGSTLTSRGVTNLVQFWLGENGFEPYLENLKAGRA